MSSAKPAWLDAANALAEQTETDVFFYNGPLARPFDWQLMELVRKRRRRRRVIVVLVTTGGDPDAAYRCAKCLQDKYERFTLLVAGYCKSAGTIVALGANELVMADGGELGPLDVQMSKQDELFQRQSGLTATAAMETLNEKAYKAFEHFLIEVVMNTGVSTRVGMQSAVQLTSGLFAQSYSHIDPMQLGEAGRAMKIAQKYGELLQRKGQNFDNFALTRLAEEYPSHSFIIDRHEASTLFKNLRQPSALEEALLGTLGNRAVFPNQHPDNLDMAYLSSEQPEPLQQVLPGTGHAAHSNQVVNNEQTQVTTERPGATEAGGGSPERNPETAERPHLAEVRSISGAA